MVGVESVPDFIFFRRRRFLGLIASPTAIHQDFGPAILASDTLRHQLGEEQRAMGMFVRLLTELRFFFWQSQDFRVQFCFNAK